ncbi:MAG: hypothetical protein R6U89_00310, partial [Dehalococcoidia bacterium]
DRVSYPFYFYPLIPAVCLAAAYVICELLTIAAQRGRREARWAIRTLPLLWLAAHSVMFWIMAPIV